ncbi:hypothetical protein [Acidovorax sp. SUPP3334]|uniref:hypothetical protein n=1 Tax=Acidovorax sp. SUPP3334 TaxID=2920881 RepID=UPI0024E17E60|nr:hypothetical protein [Acidovorax sp. SUPP3334]
MTLERVGQRMGNVLGHPLSGHGTTDELEALGRIMQRLLDHGRRLSQSARFLDGIFFHGHANGWQTAFPLLLSSSGTAHSAASSLRIGAHPFGRGRFGLAPGGTMA